MVPAAAAANHHPVTQEQFREREALQDEKMRELYSKNLRLEARLEAAIQARNRRGGFVSLSRRRHVVFLFATARYLSLAALLFNRFLSPLLHENKTRPSRMYI